MSLTLGRGGRIPLPFVATFPSWVEQIALETPMEFIDRLAELPRAEWLRIGQSLVVRIDGGPYAAAWALMQTAIADQRLGIAAWTVRDGVETAAYLASAPRVRMSRSDRRVFAAAHGAAEGAALALLVRESLAPENFNVLFAPFSQRGRACP